MEPECGPRESGPAALNLLCSVAVQSGEWRVRTHTLTPSPPLFLGGGACLGAMSKSKCYLGTQGVGIILTFAGIYQTGNKCTEYLYSGDDSKSKTLSLSLSL